MAIFLTGGTLGMALAALAGTQIVERYGIEYLWLIGIPVFILAPMILRQARKTPRAERRIAAGKIDFSILSKIRTMGTLSAISILRSIIHTGFVNFTAILGAARGWSTVFIGRIFTGYLLASTLGRIAGGYLADRMSPRKLLAFSCASSAIFHVVFCLTDGYLSLCAFFVAGFFVRPRHHHEHLPRPTRLAAQHGHGDRLDDGILMEHRGPRHTPRGLPRRLDIHPHRPNRCLAPAHPRRAPGRAFAR